MTKTEQLDRCAKNREERVLLARVLDKLQLTQQRNIPAVTSFLSPAEQASVTDLLRRCGQPRHLFYGGFDSAERKVCFFFPDWQESEDLLSEFSDSPLSAVEALFPTGTELNHRNVLGALMGLGLTREKLGDILLPEPNRCQVVALRETCPILVSQWESAGQFYCRTVREISCSELTPTPPSIKVLRDTVSTLRLDSVLASGFSLSRSKASAYITSGRVAVNHRECIKPDRLVGQGDVLTCRGLGKCVITEVAGPSRKGRIMLVLARYL